MSMVAFFLQTAEISADYVKWLTIFVGILAFSILLVCVVLAIVGVKVVGILTDVKKTFDEYKVKAMPIIGKATEITETVRGVVSDMAPKIKTVSENAVEMSHTVRQTVTKLDVTIREAADKATVTFNEANDKTKVQVSRVDGMIASTLAATAEIGATVNEGIRTPARKIAAMVTQSKHLVDTIVDRAKALGITIGSTVDAKVHPKTGKSGW